MGALVVLGLGLLSSSPITTDAASTPTSGKKAKPGAATATATATIPPATATATATSPPATATATATTPPATATATATTPPPTATATSATTTSSYSTTVLSDHPTAYWRLDETSGTTARDSAGSYPGSYVNAPTLGQPGAISGDPDTAVAFNGTSQYAGVPYNAALNPTTFSIEAWAYPTGGTGSYRAVAASRSFPNGWVLYAASNDTWQFWIANGTDMMVLGGGPVAFNQWTHLVGTFDGTTARLYVNGVATASGTPTYTPNTTQAFAIGQGEPGSNLWFPGRVDEAAHYSVALPLVRVQAHYSIGTGGSPTPTPISSTNTTSTPTPTATKPPATATATATPVPGSLPLLDSSVFSRKDLIYSSEIGSWRMQDSRYDGHYMLNYNNSCSGCGPLAQQAMIPVIRWAASDIFTDEIRPDGAYGSLPRAQFDNVINGIRALGMYPFLKLLPIAGDLNHGTVFCNTDSTNLPYYKAFVQQAGSRLQLYESTNEMDWVCGYNYSNAGVATAQHWINNMPALKKYARSLGFEIIVGGPAMTNIGGLKWGSTLSNPATGPANDFLQTIKDEYDRTGDPDLIPAFYSFHSYGTDCSGNGYTTLDCVNYYAAYIDAVRSLINQIWGPTIGPTIQIVDSEWDLSQDATYVGYTTSEASQFYQAMLTMFRQHGVWMSNQFLMASNGDALDMITESGGTQSYYNTFKNTSVNDPLR